MFASFSMALCQYLKWKLQFCFSLSFRHYLYNYFVLNFRRFCEFYKLRHSLRHFYWNFISNYQFSRPTFIEFELFINLKNVTFKQTKHSDIKNKRKSFIPHLNSSTRRQRTISREVKKYSNMSCLNISNKVRRALLGSVNVTRVRNNWKTT